MTNDSTPKGDPTTVAESRARRRKGVLAAFMMVLILGLEFAAWTHADEGGGRENA